MQDADPFACVIIAEHCGPEGKEVRAPHGDAGQKYGQARPLGRDGVRGAVPAVRFIATSVAARRVNGRLRKRRA